MDRLLDLYRTYGPIIYDRCRSLLRDDAEAEDATHETFLRVRRHLERVPLAEEALYWIYRVATNLCLNELRNRSRRALPNGHLPEPSLAAGLHPEQRLADRDLARRLIERAAPRLRAAAWLYHVDGFEQQEIASILDVSRRTVITRLASFAEFARKFVGRTGS